MDNATGVPTEAPKGQAPATAPAPSIPQAEAGTPTTQTEQAGQSQGGEELILGKFKSNEDLKEAYKNLEAHSKKVEMDRAKLSQDMAELEKLFIQSEQEAETPKANEPQGETEDQLKPILDALAPKLRDELNKSFGPIVAKMELQDALNRFGDEFKAVAPQVADKRRQNPSLSLEDAFKLVNYENLKKTSFDEGIAKASDVAEQKQKAIVESSRPSGYKPTTFEEALGSARSNKELGDVYEAMGPEYKMFAEISKRRSRGRY